MLRAMLIAPILRPSLDRRPLPPARTEPVGRAIFVNQISGPAVLAHPGPGTEGMSFDALIP